MDQRILGRTGLSVSAISLGTVEIGLDYGVAADGVAKRPDEGAAARLLHRALDLGVNLIDTARAYGESEAIIGRALKGRRREFILCSKVSAYSGETDTRQKIISSVETSLRLLETDVIDVMMLHSAPTEVISQGEALGVLEELRTKGWVQWIGASTYGVEATAEGIGCGRCDCLQVACSALDRRNEADIWQAARSGGIGIVARSVLLKGVLTPRYAYLPDSLAELKSAASELTSLAEQAGITLPELAYRYILSRDVPHSALVGASNVSELEAAVAFAEAGPLPADLEARVRRVGVANERLLNPGTWGIG